MLSRAESLEAVSNSGGYASVAAGGTRGWQCMVCLGCPFATLPPQVHDDGKVRLDKDVH